MTPIVNNAAIFAKLMEEEPREFWVHVVRRTGVVIGCGPCKYDSPQDDEKIESIRVREVIE